MAQIPYRGNTQGMTFPLLSIKAGMTIINGQGDQTFFPQVSTDGQVPIDRGIPNAIYAHNVMPSTNGWRSVGYLPLFSAPATGGPFNFDRTFYIQGAQLIDGKPSSIDSRVYMALAKNGGTGIIYKAGTGGQWTPIANGQPVIPADCEMTTAEVNGVTYIYFSRVGCYVYNPLTDTLIERTLSTLDKGAITGIVSSSGYLLAYTPTSIAWSSSVDVENFDPNDGDVTGAGGGQVQEAKGAIVCARSTYLGILLFTTANVISVTYSGNESFPWNFKAVPSAGGVLSSDMVAQKELSAYFYAFTIYGMQQITHARASTVLPYITDFFGEEVFEDYDFATDTFTRVLSTNPFRKKVSTIADRYIVVSYGLSPNEAMTHAIIVDMGQNRIGKLKFTHNYVFERVPFNSAQDEIPKESIALLAPDGTSKTVSFSVEGAVTSYDSVLVMGRYQYARQRKVQLQELIATSMWTGAPSSIVVKPSYDGFTDEAPVSAYLYKDSGTGLKHYKFPACVGENFTVTFKGVFDIFSYELWLTLHGRY
jgi:hypothetical protein